MQDFIVFENVSKNYHVGEVTIHALKDITFTIPKGEICIIVGESGAGKTTLLNILGGMDTLSDGRISVDGVDISSYSAKELTEFRRSDIGFVFQFYNLIPNMTALENVEIAVNLCEDALNPEEVLKQVGLEDRMENFPSQLSGGEQQRVAIARALAKNPKVLLCDEPTGALDYKTGKHILKLLQETAEKTGTTVIIITHNKALCKMAKQVIHINSGEINQVDHNDEIVPIEDIEW